MNLFSMKTGKRDLDKSSYNGGYTLVELIVVIAIMAVLTGMLSLGISMMFSRDAQSVAVTIDDELSEVRMMSMSRAGNYTMTLHTTSDVSKDNKIIIDDGDSSTPQREISLNKSVKITVEQKNGSGTYSTSGGEDIEIVFDKGNGSVKTIDGSPASGVYVITVSSSAGGTAKTATVTLVATTGRHYTEK